MKTFAGIALAIGAVLVAGALAFGMYVLGDYRLAVADEVGITANVDDVENVLGAGYAKMGAQGAAADKFGDLYKQGLQIGMEGRYGKTGSQAAMQWITEQNPSLPPNILQALQDAIEATFNKFEAAQTAKIARIQVYDKLLQDPIDGAIVGFFGFPKIDLAELRKVISSKDIKNTMQTHELPEQAFK